MSEKWLIRKNDDLKRSNKLAVVMELKKISALEAKIRKAKTWLCVKPI